MPGAQTAELVLAEPLLSMGLLTLPQLHSSTSPSAPAPCCHHSQGLEELGGSWLGGPGREMHLLHRRGLHPSQGIKLQHVNSLSPACSADPALHVGETLRIVGCNNAQLEQCLLVLVLLLWCNTEVLVAGVGGVTRCL